MTSLIEVNTETKSTSTDAMFYSETFTRPTNISPELFAASIKAMEDAIQRNLYAHWTLADGTIRPACLHEVSRAHNLASCADCRKNAIPLNRVIVEQEWEKKLQEEDLANDDHISMLHACGVTVEWLLAFTFDHNCWNNINFHYWSLAYHTPSNRTGDGFI